MLLLTLPGSAFVYQGDEIGMGNGPGAKPPRDRVGRDSFRHPMQWDGSAGGGFTTGTPWLPLDDPAVRNVADQRGDPGSLLSFYRDLIALRRTLPAPFEAVDDIPGVVVVPAEAIVLSRSTSPRSGVRSPAARFCSRRRPAPSRVTDRLRGMPAP